MIAENKTGVWPAVAPLVLIALVWLLQERLGVARSVEWGGLSRAGLVAGRWWTPLTSILLHVSLIHAGLNSLALFLFGRILARRLSAPAYGLFFLLCGLAGALGYLLLHFDAGELAVGASDVVFGLWGGFARVAGTEGEARPLLSRFVALQAAGAIAVNLVLIAVLRLTTGAWAAWAGHLGGFLAGLFLIQPLLRRPPTP